MHACGGRRSRWVAWAAAATAIGAATAAVAAKSDEGLTRATEALHAGRYAEVAALSAGSGATHRDAADLLVARAELATGHYAEAEKRLAALVKRAPAELEARIELARLLEATGRQDEAKTIWNRFFDEYEQGSLDKTSARVLTAVGVAARGLGSYQDANDLFREAVEADPKYFPARLEWGATFLEKYAAGEAEQDAEKALELSPTDADAQVLLGRVKIEQGDVPAVNRAIDAALKKNPHHAGALALRARLALEVDDHAGVESDCRHLLNTNPKDEAAHTLLGAIRFLDDDRAGYEAEKRAVLAIHPRSSAFFHGVAEALVFQHRYEEANLLEAEAIKTNPRDARSLAEIGQNLLRLGEEQKGHDALTRAFQLDAFNVRTYNLLNLLEDVIPKRYRFVDAGPFRLRVSTKEAPFLERTLPPIVKREWEELTRRYGFVPQAPVQVELYADPQHYAVRTIGLPGLEALGVTFGKVVTGRSPAEGRFNWGMMLWHEIGHVFAIQLSRSRVPRWFTEGLSEYETELHEHDWRRHTHPELYVALTAGKLLSVGALNTGFVRARTVDNIVVAYHEAAEAVSFLVRRFGFPKVVEALRLFAAGKPTHEVIRAVTGLEVAGFDREFQADLRQRLKVYEGQFFLRPTDYADAEALAAEADAHPTDARAQALYGLALLAHRGDNAQAGQRIAKALLLSPNLKEALFAQGVLLSNLGNQDHGAELVLRRLIAAGGDGFDVRMKLAESLGRQKQVLPTVAELERAARFDPEASEPHELLARIHLHEKHDDDALRELEAAAHLDIHDASLTRTLVTRYAERKQWPKVREYAAANAWIDPYNPEMRRLAGRAALEMKDARAAVGELELALLGEPKKPSEARGLLARALAAAGDVTRARAVAAETLKEDPANPDAKLVH